MDINNLKIDLEDAQDFLKVLKERVEISYNSQLIEGIKDYERGLHDGETKRMFEQFYGDFSELIMELHQYFDNEEIICPSKNSEDIIVDNRNLIRETAND